MPGARTGDSKLRDSQRCAQALRVVLLLLTAASSLYCGRNKNSPQLLYEHANQAFLIGQLKQGQDEAERGYKQFRDSNPAWASKFRILQARSALWRGLYPDVLAILDPPSYFSDRLDMAIPRLALVGTARVYLHDFPVAEKILGEATKLCAENASDACGDVLQGLGFLASERKQTASAERYYKLSLAFADSHNDPFLKSMSLLNLGAESLAKGRFDEAIDWSLAAHQVASALNAKAIDFVIEGNLGWAYYKLGDSEKAYNLEVEALALAEQLQDVSNQENQLTNIGYIYLDQGKLELAEKSFQRALDLANGIKAKEQIYNALRVLALYSVQARDLDKASDYADRALEIARQSDLHLDELYPAFVQGQVSALRGDAAKAQQILETVERDPACPVFLKWEAQHSLARLYQDQKQPDAADHEYRAALDTFEAARATVRREDFQLSFLSNASHIYGDYIRFLVTQHRPDEALRWADFSRARALAEGLGMLASNVRRATNGSNFSPPALNAQNIARRAKGTLLFYWLGDKQSYLWAITSKKTKLFTLPPGAEIEAAVKRYRAALTGPQNVLESSGDDGQALYRTLIAQAEPLFANGERVLVLADGVLNNLNFETLIVPSPKPHFWIEDAEVVNASSLRVLDASLNAKPAKAPRMLLIGDSISPGKDYPELPKAADQMANVAQHFSSAMPRVFQREKATPAAYLNADLSHFSHIHFVAHGTASRLSPLDSAIILSKESDNPESFKLYARDIIHHPLRAELVTISACYGAGERQYSGEGLVGLAWAFLRAGSRNVIAALWEVSDASTDQLMDRFYDGLSKGASPDAALRNAKLALLHSNSFHNPFYWAPFQLYRG